MCYAKEILLNDVTGAIVLIIIKIIKHFAMEYNSTVEQSYKSTHTK